MRTPEQRRQSTRWFDVAPFVRIGLVILLVLMLFGMIYVLLSLLRAHAVILYAAMEITCALIMVYLLAYSNQGGAYKYAWVLVVMLLGVFGLGLYLIWGRNTLTNALDKRLKFCLDKENAPLPQEPSTLEAFEKIDSESLQRIGRYLRRQGFPVYAYTKSTYFPLGEDAFEAMLEDLAGAQKSIYLEFFIISNGQVWERFFEVLSRKAQAGVDVRLMYDDMGSLKTSTGTFINRMRDAGIRVSVFNPVHHHVHQLYLNYRNHRKMLIIDGQVAYTGGINLADEYANLYEKHGHWKDTAVRLDGPGAEAFQRFFLVMWHAVNDDDMVQELQSVQKPRPYLEEAGFVQPFEDGPHNNPQNPAEGLYRQMIANAQDHVYITTPYLVIDEPMLDALKIAAASGVDVRLVIPMVPDHWYVHWTSLSFVGPLMEEGVRIYRYTPGFIHAKMLTVDGKHCVVGSVNMDYRSFYLHYECGVWFAGGSMPGTVRDDIEAVLAVSEEMTYAQWKKRPLGLKIVQPLLRMFAPLM